MATSNKIFVSPGVYTSERDLSFVTQSVGVTTLGIAGESLQGPAFEPIFITDYNEFETYFGGTSPEKFVNTQIPKYEAAYIAKAYLQQSNQMFMTRILGLSGYDAGPSWSIKTVANVDKSTVGLQKLCVSTPNFTNNPPTCDITCTPIESAFTLTFSGCVSDGTPVLSTIALTSDFPEEIMSIYTNQYETFNGGVSTLETQVLTQITSVLSDLATQNTNIYYYGSICSDDYTNLSSVFTEETNVFQVPNVSITGTSLTAPQNDSWYYALFEKEGSPTFTNSYTGFSFWTVLSGVTLVPVTPTTTLPIPTPTPTPTPNPCDPINPNPEPTPTPTPVITDCYTGTVVGKIYYYTGTSYVEYDDLVIATLRSRGIGTLANPGPNYQVTGLTDADLVTDGVYFSVRKNPFATFAISGLTKDNDDFFFETSFQSSDVNYISKVFGQTNFGKPRTEVPLFLEESYPTLLLDSWRKGYIRGLSSEFLSLPAGRPGGLEGDNNETIGWYLEKYQSPSTPYVVSELRGNKVYPLFRMITISDGDNANTQVKVSIINISFSNLTFDLVVRDFFDTDENPIVLEKYTNCNMNPTTNNYVAKKIGTVDGEFELKSKFIMVEVNVDAPFDALPCGFEGYVTRKYSTSRSPFPLLKNEYYFPGQVVYDPPFGSSSGLNDSVPEAGDKVRKTFLGFSTKLGYDFSFLEYKGKVPPNSPCSSEGGTWNYITQGFHMDSGANVIKIPAGFVTSGEPAFLCGTAEFRQDPESTNNPYYFLYSRKFTILFNGGFDGWDIYRESRTNTTDYMLGNLGYLRGANPDCSFRYTNATGWGAFKEISVPGDDSTEWANTDYYAYLLGIRTYANPESVNINVFTTPGIDLVNHDNLVESTIEMIETERADSIYITTMPDYDMFAPTLGFDSDKIFPQEAVDLLEETGIDSNYTATYYPWVLTRDTVNNTQIYIPATAEVTRNLALTDNISFPWFASAGYSRGLVNAIKARIKLTQEDRDILYKGRLNPIATFSDVGTVIWGNKTLQIRESALDRLNVRRLLLQARKLISAVSVRLLFEQNDQIVRQQFLDAVNPILDSIRRDRGLYDFRVTVSSSPEDLDRNQLVGKIYIKPTRSLEFIDIEFLITPTGASFENI
jgi:hypothetical protein